MASPNTKRRRARSVTENNDSTSSNSGSAPNVKRRRISSDGSLYGAITDLDESTTRMILFDCAKSNDRIRDRILETAGKGGEETGEDAGHGDVGDELEDEEIVIDQAIDQTSPNGVRDLALCRVLDETVFA